MRKRYWKTIAMGVLAVLTLTAAACARKPQYLSESDLAQIHEKEQELRAQVADITWHYEDEPDNAWIFRSDGTAEYYGGEATWIDHYTWELKYSEYFDVQEGVDITQVEKEKVEKYYDYNLVCVDVEPDGEKKPFLMKVEFTGDDLKMDYRQMVKGQDWLYDIPENLETEDDFLYKLYRSNGGYRMFYEDGTGFGCSAVVMQSPYDAYKFYWGVENGILYMKYPLTVNDDGSYNYQVDSFKYEKDGESCLMTDLWTNGKTKLEYIDIQDKTMNELQLEESIALINSYDKLHAEIADW